MDDLQNKTALGPGITLFPDIETSSEDYARRFAGSAGEYFLEVQAEGIEILLRDIPDATVLEVGGGHGQLVPVFLRRGFELTILSSDDSANARLRARFPGAPLNHVSGDLLRLPWPECSFDVVAAVRLLTHVDDWAGLLGEFCRVARRSVIVDFPSWRSINALTPLLFPFKKNIEKNTRPYTNFLPSRLAREFRRHDFEVARSFGQFVVPMVLHRAAGGHRGLKACERVCRAAGLTSLFGSPVLLRADRGKAPGVT